ncbi:translocation/assembly module TamB, partial [Flavobacteriaceae bacterium]|nr:translocation/assembly module TamB [Flavobacteriaceae bacterium]
MAVLLLMFITLVLLFSIPLVQNKVGSYVTNSLNEDFGTNINIEKVGLKFNGDVSLKNIFIEDYKKDTLLIVKQLNTSVLSVNNILNNKLTFGDIAIEGLYLNIRTYQEERQTNLDVFVDKLDSEAPTTKSKTPFLLSSSNISIKESAFKLVDDNKQESNILNFSNLIINAQDFLILGPKVNATITAFSFYDTRGVTIKNLATDFSYSRSAMVFNDLSITTNASQIKGALTFQYEREDLQYFEDKVRITASFDNSVIALNELNTFYNEFGVDQVARVNVNLSGTLNDLKATQLNLKTSNKTIIDGDVVFKNLFNKSKNTFEMLGSFNSIASNYKDLTSLLPNILGKPIPSVMDKFGTFNMTGTTNITSASIDADLEIDTEIGYIIAELALQDINDIDNAAYKGNVIFDEFLMGRLVNNEKIGEVSFNVYADGKGFRPDNINTQVEGTIYGLNYNDYYYTNVTLNGNLRDKIFNGYINTKDDNLDLNFQGLVDFSEAENNYNFNAEVNHANLKVLNFVKNDSMSLFKGRVAMNMKGTTLDNAYGTIDFQNTLYTNEYDAYYFKDFSIASNFKNNERTLSVNSPEIIEGTMKGDFKLKEVVKLVENSLGNLYTNYRPYAIADDQNIVFNFKVYNKIAEVFYPGLNIGKNTFFKGSIGSNAEAFNLVFKSPEISIDEHHASNIELRLDNNNV